MCISKNRKISAILFADIVGYTALMQKDETTALQIVEKFRSILTEKVSQFNGQIINDYGDGCLCTFDTAIEAGSISMKRRNGKTGMICILNGQSYWTKL